MIYFPFSEFYGTKEFCTTWIQASNIEEAFTEFTKLIKDVGAVNYSVRIGRPESWHWCISFPGGPCK